MRQAAIATLLFVSTVIATPVVADDYDPPAGYYDTGTGARLKARLEQAKPLPARCEPFSYDYLSPQADPTGKL